MSHDLPGSFVNIPASERLPRPARPPAASAKSGRLLRRCRLRRPGRGGAAVAGQGAPSKPVAPRPDAAEAGSAKAAPRPTDAQRPKAVDAKDAAPASLRRATGRHEDDEISRRGSPRQRRAAAPAATGPSPAGCRPGWPRSPSSRRQPLTAAAAATPRLSRRSSSPSRRGADVPDSTATAPSPLCRRWSPSAGAPVRASARAAAPRRPRPPRRSADRTPAPAVEAPAPHSARLAATPASAAAPTTPQHARPAPLPRSTLRRRCRPGDSCRRRRSRCGASGRRVAGQPVRRTEPLVRPALRRSRPR